MTKGWRYESNRHALAARGILTARAISRDSLPFPPKTYDLYNLGQIQTIKKYGNPDPDNFGKDLRRAWKAGDESLMYVWLYNFPNNHVAILTYDDLQVKWLLGMYGKKSDILKLLKKMISERNRMEKKYPEGKVHVRSEVYDTLKNKMSGEVIEYDEPLPDYADVERIAYEIEHSNMKPNDMMMFTTTDSEDFDCMDTILGLWEKKGRKTILSNIGASSTDKRETRKFIFRTCLLYTSPSPRDCS